jgi:TolA-binding protein
MDSLHSQISELNTKVDSLHQRFEQFGDQTSEILLTLKQLKVDPGSTASSTSLGRQTYHSYQNRGVLESDMDHKDILADFSLTDLEGQSSDRNLTPEVQIQRLTAQLTAAYNRIAALEEQLLARRILS